MTCRTHSPRGTRLLTNAVAKYLVTDRDPGVHRNYIKAKQMRSWSPSLNVASRRYTVLAAALLFFFSASMYAITFKKRAYTCAECRKLKWEYKWHNTIIKSVEVDNSCSKWLAIHEQRPHIHSWIEGENIWFVGLLGDHRGVASTEYHSYIWRISPDQQLAVYAHVVGEDALTHTRSLFREFYDCRGGRHCELKLRDIIDPMITNASTSKVSSDG